MLSAWDADPYTHEDHAYLQLFNAGGVLWNQGLPAAPAQAAGMHTVFEDDFTTPLSISRCGLPVASGGAHSLGRITRRADTSWENWNIGSAPG